MTQRKLIVTLAVLAGVVVLLAPARETQAGGWSVSIGGISFGSGGHGGYRSYSHYPSRRYYRHHGRRRYYRRGPVVQDITPYYGHPPVYAVQPYPGHPTVIVSPQNSYRSSRRYSRRGHCR